MTQATEIVSFSNCSNQIQMCDQIVRAIRSANFHLRAWWREVIAIYEQGPQSNCMCQKIKRSVFGLAAWAFYLTANGTLLILMASVPAARPIIVSIALWLTLLKSIALIAGITWLMRSSRNAMNTFRRQWIYLRHKTKREKKLFLYDVLLKDNPWFSPFGIMDCKWRRLTQSAKSDESLGVRALRHSAEWARGLFFRYESHAMWFGLLLFLCPFRPSDDVEWTSLALAACLLVNAALMGYEIMIGTALLGSDYTNFFHLAAAEQESEPTGGGVVILQVTHFGRMFGVTIIAMASVCFVCFGWFGGFDFDGVAKGSPGIDVASELGKRLEWFIQFLTFAVTTFTTVGYGDIHPDLWITRLVVGVIQVLSIFYVAILLQILLSRGSGSRS